MYVILNVAKYKGIKWVLGLLSMPIFHIYLFFNKSKYPFFKLMGVGKNGTFDINPDKYQWAFMSVFDTQNHYENFKSQSFIFRYVSKWAESCKEIILVPKQVHGLWDGKMPFSAQEKYIPTENQPIAVLTRASIKVLKARSFWANVPKVAESMTQATGLIYSIGIGEVPFLKQATLSIWNSEAEMMAFAYKQKEHKTVINKTRTEGWYSEEMFTRFWVHRF